jgi:excisionase family DNA binding protein
VAQHDPPEHGLADDRLLNSIRTVCQRTTLGRTRIFTEIRTGRLRSVKVGRRRLVPETALREFVADLEARGRG